MSLNDLSLPAGVQDKDLVSIIQREYPGYDKHLHSKCRHPDKYGVQPLPEALSVVCEVYGIEQAKQRKKENRKLPCRVSCRLSQSEYSELQLAIRADGYDTMQAWLALQLRRYLKRHKNKQKHERVSEIGVA